MCADAKKRVEVDLRSGYTTMTVKIALVIRQTQHIIQVNVKYNDRVLHNISFIWSALEYPKCRWVNLFGSYVQRKGN